MIWKANIILLLFTCAVSLSSIRTLTTFNHYIGSLSIPYKVPSVETTHHIKHETYTDTTGKHTLIPLGYLVDEKVFQTVNHLPIQLEYASSIRDILHIVFPVISGILYKQIPYDFIDTALYVSQKETTKFISEIKKQLEEHISNEYTRLNNMIQTEMDSAYQKLFDTKNSETSVSLLYKVSHIVESILFNRVERFIQYKDDRMKALSLQMMRDQEKLMKRLLEDLIQYKSDAIINFLADLKYQVLTFGNVMYSSMLYYLYILISALYINRQISIEFYIGWSTTIFSLILSSNPILASIIPIMTTFLRSFIREPIVHLSDSKYQGTMGSL